MTIFHCGSSPRDRTVTLGITDGTLSVVFAELSMHTLLRLLALASFPSSSLARFKENDERVPRDAIDIMISLLVFGSIDLFDRECLVSSLGEFFFSIVGVEMEFEDDL